MRRAENLPPLAGSTFSLRRLRDRRTQEQSSSDLEEVVQAASWASAKKLRLRQQSLRFAAAGERRTAEIGGSLFSHLSAGFGPTGCLRNPNGADQEGAYYQRAE